MPFSMIYSSEGIFNATSCAGKYYFEPLDLVMSICNDKIVFNGTITTCTYKQSRHLSILYHIRHYFKSALEYSAIHSQYLYNLLCGPSSYALPSSPPVIGGDDACSRERPSYYQLMSSCVRNVQCFFFTFLIFSIPYSLLFLFIYICSAVIMRQRRRRDMMRNERKRSEWVASENEL